jgi:hypothetical protein
VIFSPLGGLPLGGFPEELAAITPNGAILNLRRRKTPIKVYNEDEETLLLLWWMMQ